MSYQHYMNMGFAAGGAAYGAGSGGGNHPYLMAGMQMQNKPMPYATNHLSSGNMHLANQAAAMMPTVKGGKRKINNDPNKPKRPTSAYFYFVQMQREEAAKRGEKITRVAEWTKEVSAKWRALTPQDKEQYNRLAAIDKERYDHQMEVYTGKDKNRPKRPQSAYFLWLADFRANMKDKFTENKDILRAAGEEWRKLTTEAKAPYEQKAEEKRRKYEAAMRDYNMSGGAAKKAKMNEEAASQSLAAAQNYRSTDSYKPTTQQQPSQEQQLQQQRQLLQQQQQQQREQQMQQQLRQQQQQQQQHLNTDDDDDDDDQDDEDGYDDEEDDYE